MKRILIAAGFALLYLYDVWEAVSTLIELPRFYAAIGLASDQVPWWLLIAGVALPPLVYTAAILIGRRLSPGRFAFVLLVGLAVVAALSLGAVALEFWVRPSSFVF